MSNVVTILVTYSSRKNSFSSLIHKEWRSLKGKRFFKRVDIISKNCTEESLIPYSLRTWWGLEKEWGHLVTNTGRMTKDVTRKTQTLGN